MTYLIAAFFVLIKTNMFSLLHMQEIIFVRSNVELVK